MMAKCLELGFAREFDADFVVDAERREGREEDEAAEGWLLDAVVAGLKSAVFVLRLRFICVLQKLLWSLQYALLWRLHKSHIFRIVDAV